MKKIKDKNTGEWREEAPDEQWMREQQERTMTPAQRDVRISRPTDAKDWVLWEWRRLERERKRIARSKVNKRYREKCKRKRVFYTKKCTKCGILKSGADFYADKRNKDMLQSWCKECRKKTRPGIKRVQYGMQQMRAG